MDEAPTGPYNRLTPRPGAFTILERALAAGVPWVWGPPGSGKTALIDGFLAARGMPAVRLAAAPAHAELETALADLHAQARALRGGAALAAPTGLDWFAQLFHHLPNPLLLVFDDYHRAPHALHPLVAAAVASAPPGRGVVVLSRAEPPAELARRLPPGTLVRVGWRALRLSRVDARAIAHQYRFTSPRDIATLHAASGGLPAAFTRLLAAGVPPERAHEAATAAGPLACVPPMPSGGPLRLSVATLGGFEIRTQAGPLRHHRKPPRRPLELLKYLVVAGPDGMPEIHVMTQLWPGAEPDVAARALATTLHRLRALLDCPECVVRTHGWLRLDPKRIWVDAWTLTRALDQAGTPPASGPLSDALADNLATALALYRAPLLAGDGNAPWLLPTRERLHTRVLRWVGALGRHFEAAGRWPEAEETYRHGLALEPESQRLAQGLERALAGVRQRPPQGGGVAAAMGGTAPLPALDEDAGDDGDGDTDGAADDMA